MTKYDALIVLIREARKEGASVAANKRILRAFKALNLTGDEVRLTGAYLEVWNHEGKPYLQDSPSFDDYARGQS